MQYGFYHVNSKVQEIALNREITRAYALRAGSARRLPGNRAINRWPRLIERVIARRRVIARNARVSERKSFARSPAGGEAGRLARGRERLARARARDQCTATAATFPIDSRLLSQSNLSCASCPARPSRPSRLPRLCFPPPSFRRPPPAFRSAVVRQEKVSRSLRPCLPLTPPCKSAATVPPCLPVRRRPWWYSGNLLLLYGLLL